VTKKNEKVSGTKVYGPYKGSKQNGGRKTVVVYNSKTGKMGSKNYARQKKEDELGHKLSKNEHVDHKDNNKDHNGSKNLQVMSAKKNIGKGNQHRKKK
jgi:CRISPR/Cas system CMR-associated protein Cmr5 small subunit